MANEELITTAAYTGYYGSLNAGDTTVGRGWPKAEKERILSDFAATFSTYSDLQIDLDSAAADLASKDAVAATTLEATTAANDAYLALKVISDAAASDAADALTAFNAALAAYIDDTKTSVNVAENTTAVATVAGVLATGSVVFSIYGGADADLFSVDDETGALAFKVAPNYEDPTDSDTDNVYVVAVKATDGVLTDIIGYYVTVTDAVEA